MSNLRFSVVSCANGEAGYFSSYRNLAARADPDAWLHLGDRTPREAERGLSLGPFVPHARRHTAGGADVQPV